jgi:uncharacterized protein YjiS (DUF1127 family)
MAFVTASAPFHLGSGLLTSIRALIVKLNAARARRAVFDQVYSDLSAMTDRELADINISRIVIRDIAMAASEKAA